MQPISKARLERQEEQNKLVQEEQKQREHTFELEKRKKANKKYVIIAVSLLIFLLLGVWFVYSTLSPGKYDDFAKCLTEKGAVMYGEDWCKYTLAQKGMFGKSFKYINYQVKENLKLRPTWEINGKTYTTVQSFETLSALTGCKI